MVSPGTLSIKVPSKIFLLGEYLVIAGGPALLAAVHPQFELVWSENAQGLPPMPFDPESPAGKLFSQALRDNAGEPNGGLIFKDPHRGVGGLGASSAQFLALSQILSLSAKVGQRRFESLKEILIEYIELATVGGVRPSGADVAIQWTGGAALISGLMGLPLSAPSVTEFRTESQKRVFSKVYVFSAAHKRKVPTHEYLKTFGAAGVQRFRESMVPSDLRQVLESGVSVVREGDSSTLGLTKLGRAFSEYARILEKAELEHPEATRDRLAIEALPGVYGVKGSGALLADLVLVCSENEEELMKTASKLSLKLVSKGLDFAPGVRP